MAADSLSPTPHRVLSPVTGTGPTSAAHPLSIGGYRVVRRLGGGSTATVMLAWGGGRSVALRRYRDAVPDAQIDAEVEALGRVRSRHLATLLDLATGPDGRPVPVLDAVIGPRLHELLRARAGVLEPGEAVTVLVPLVELLHELHEVGVTVGRWDAAGVRIGADGAPVLTALSGMTVSPPLPERFRRSEPGVTADLAGLRSLGEHVVAAVRADRRDALREAVVRITDLQEMERALFDAARPTPLILEMSVASIPGTRAFTASSHPSSVAGPEAPQRERPIDRVRTALLRTLDDLGLPENVIASLRRRPAGADVRAEPDAERRTRRGSRLLQGFRSRPRAKGYSSPLPTSPRLSRGAQRATSERRGRAGRPRRSVVLVGAAGLIALIGAGVLVTVGDGGIGAAAPDRTGISIHSGEPTPGAEGAVGESTVSKDSGDATAPPAAKDPSTTPSVDPADDARALVDSGSDPEPEKWPALVDELARRWVECRQEVAAGEGQPACAEAVVQGGSAAAELLVSPNAVAADSLLVPPVGEVVVVDRLGSAALVDLVQPAGTRTASLLVMRSEAGWRIRSVLD